MSEAKFTRGPWMLDAGFESGRPGDFDEYWQVHDGMDAIACSSNCCAGNREASARLIAAAPDLYEALDACLGLILNQEMQDGFESQQGYMARAALAKARGES